MKAFCVHGKRWYERCYGCDPPVMIELDEWQERYMYDAVFHHSVNRSVQFFAWLRRVRDEEILKGE